MSSEKFRTGEIIPIEAVMELGASGVVFIREKLNDEYFDGLVFVGTRVSVAMLLVETTVDRTFWKFDFNTSLGLDTNNYVIEPRNEALTATIQPEVLFAYVDPFFNSLEEKVSRILGLSHENIVIESTAYDPVSSQPTVSTAKVYDTAANAAANTALGLQDTYDVLATYDTQGRLVSFTQTRVGG